MCNPMVLAGAMFATQAAGAYQQHKVAEAQAEAQTDMYNQNRENSFKALGQQYGDIGAREIQEQQASAEQKEEIARQERAKRAAALVRGGEMGITGKSFDMNLADISGAAARDRSTIDRNLSWTLGQLQRQKTSAQTQAVNQINSMQPGQKPSNLSLGINVANAAVGAGMQYQTVKPQA